MKRLARDALLTKDNVRAELDVSFTVRVDATTESILRVAASLGCAKVGDPAALDAHFGPSFASALASCVRAVTFEDLLSRRDELQDAVARSALDTVPDGFRLDGVAIERIERAARDADGPFR